MSTLEISYYSSAGSNKGRIMRFDDFHAKVRGGLWAPQIRKCREILAPGTEDAWRAYKSYRSNNVTHIAAHGIMPDKSRGVPMADRITRFIGLAQLDFDGLDPQTLEAMRAVAVADPHVYWAAISPSGHGLKVLLRVPEAKTVAEWQVISASAERYACLAFGRPCEHGSVAEATKLLCATHDPEAYYNPQAEPIEAGAPAGTRHDTIKKIVASGVARGLDDEQIHAEVREQIPDEDKDDDEIDKIIAWTRAQESKKANPAKPGTGTSSKTPPGPTLRERMLARLYDPSKVVCEPDYRYTFKGVPIISAGNVSSLVSVPKGGKSSVVMAFIAAGCDDREHLGIRGDNKNKRPVVHLDTEQSAYHHAQKLKTVEKRIGIDLPAHVFSFRLTGEVLGIENVRDAIAIAVEKTGKQPYAVLLDGGVDFLLDPNDPPRSFEMVRDLMAESDAHDCVVLASIHYNPVPKGGTPKSRGHLGSELERKSEAYLTITRDSESQTRNLYTKFARGKEVPEADGQRFAWDDVDGMFQPVTDADKGYTVERVLGILDREGNQTRPQLKRLLKENHGGDPKTWERRIVAAHRDGLVTTSGKPAKVCITDNGKCKLKTHIEQEEDGDDGDPF